MLLLFEKNFRCQVFSLDKQGLPVYNGQALRRRGLP